MEMVSAAEFLRWATDRGIGFDERYPDAHCLGFVPPRDFARFWALPKAPSTWPDLAATVLEGLDDWSYGFLRPRSGEWPGTDQASSPQEGVRRFVLRSAGIPEGWPGAVRFSRDEEDAIVSILFIYLTFGWCVDDDLYFIPERGCQLVQTDHHDVIHVECIEERRMLEFVRHMSQADYELPTEPPDWTFKRPAWMGEEPGR
jgi:hypothetical protein